MASNFCLRPPMCVPEKTLEALEHLCMAQSEQSFVCANELEMRLRDTRKWWRLDCVGETSEICNTFLRDPHFALLGKYLTKTLKVLEVQDFLRLYCSYLAPFNLSLPEPHEFQNNGLIHNMCDRNLRMFAEAFATIYGHYSVQTVSSCVKIDIELQVRSGCQFDDKIVFPRLGSIVFDFFGRVLSYLPGTSFATLWPDYSPQRTVCQNL